MRSRFDRHHSPVRRPALAVATCATLFVGCATTEVSFEDVAPAEELYEQALEQLEGINFLVYRYIDYSAAIETLQSIIDNYPYSDYAVKAELRIADAYFADGRYDEALSYYRDFGDLHPQHPEVPYTLLRSALCHYEQIKSVNRDQTATREAQHYLEQLIRRYPYAPETRQGEAVLRELRTRLAYNVMETGDFYLARDEFQAAAERYRLLLNTYPGLGIDAEGLFKLGVCYENMKLEDEALRLFHVVMENFPKSELSEEAAEHISAAN